jgi:leader peptidase (prepilin peptidase) / N-methyltransferase
VILAEFPLWFLRAFAVGMGLLWGSFLNVVIYRMPRDLNVAKPASHCPKCKAPIKPWNNIPVISYLLMGGRARCCGALVSPRYAVVEALGGVLALAIVETHIRQLPEATSMLAASAVFGAYFFVVLALLAGIFIDLEHMYLPNEITLGGAAFGVITARIRGYTFTEAAIGGVIGPFIIFTVNVLYKRLRGRTGIGMGDSKLLALCGAWGGWQAAAFALFAGSVLGTLVSVTIRLCGVKLELPEAVKEEIADLRERAAKGDKEAIEDLALDPVAEQHGDGFMQRPIPFGPFLIIALYGYMFGLEPWVKRAFAELLAPI